MPRKKVFEKDTITQVIRRKDYERIKAKRYGTEPFYSTVRRILDHSDSSKEELTTWLLDAQRNVHIWKERALKAEAKLEKISKIQQVLM